MLPASPPLSDPPGPFVATLYGGYRSRFGELLESGGELTPDAVDRLRYNALGKLPEPTTRELVYIVRASGALQKVERPRYDDPERMRGAVRFDPDEADEAARHAYELLHIANTGFVEGLVRTYAPAGVAPEALRQESHFAVNDAIASFNFDAEANFLTHLNWQVKGAFSHAITRSNDRDLISVPRDISAVKRHITSALRKANQEGYDVDHPSLELLAELTGDSIEGIKEALDPVQQPLRFDSPVVFTDSDGVTRSFTPEDRLPAAPHSDSAEIVEAAWRRERIGQAVAELPTDFMRRMVEYRFGLNGASEQPLWALSEALYHDQDGRAFTPDKKVADRYAREEDLPVTVLPRATMRARYEDGSLSYTPANEPTAELTELYLQSGIAEDGELPTSPPTMVVLQSAWELADRWMSVQLQVLEDGRERQLGALRRDARHVSALPPIPFPEPTSAAKQAAQGAPGVAANPQRDKKVKTIDAVEMQTLNLLGSDEVNYRYKECAWTGKLLPDGRVLVEGETEARTLGGAVHHLTGRWDSGYMSWKGTDADGKERTLNAIRHDYLLAQEIAPQRSERTLAATVSRPTLDSLNADVAPDERPQLRPTLDSLNPDVAPDERPQLRPTLDSPDAEMVLSIEPEPDHTQTPELDL